MKTQTLRKNSSDQLSGWVSQDAGASLPCSSQTGSPSGSLRSGLGGHGSGMDLGPSGSSAYVPFQLPLAFLWRANTEL